MGRLGARARSFCCAHRARFVFSLRLELVSCAFRSLPAQWVSNRGVTQFCEDSEPAEQVTLCYDRTSGLRAVIAIDDSTLGPGLGGVRWQNYPSQFAAENEARRLARVMTLKNACADLPYGGAKSVLLKDQVVGTHDGIERRVAQLRAFGRFLNRLGGAYIPGVDMGTSVEDLAEIGTVARQVSCDHEDPSPWTALGVFAGIEAVLTSTGTTLSGTHVIVQGAGHVGGELARLLAAGGCRVSVADTDTARAQAIVKDIGGSIVEPAAAPTTPCDVFAPCAGARVISLTNVDDLRCRIVAGGANDVLASSEMATILDQRGITYVPDFVLNAGGVIHIHALRSEWDLEKLKGSLFAIGDRVARIVTEADRSRKTPLAVAEEMASHRLGRLVTLPS
jgi:leucine dehydrogenase